MQPWRSDPLNQSFSICSWKTKGKCKPDFEKHKDKICSSSHFIHYCCSEEKQRANLVTPASLTGRRRNFKIRENMSMQTCGTWHLRFGPSCLAKYLSKSPSLSTANAFRNALKATEFPPKQLFCSDVLLTVMFITIFFQLPCSFSFARLGFFLCC